MRRKKYLKAIAIAAAISLSLEMTGAAMTGQVFADAVGNADPSGNNGNMGDMTPPEKPEGDTSGPGTGAMPGGDAVSGNGSMAGGPYAAEKGLHAGAYAYGKGTDPGQGARLKCRRR